MKFIYMLNIQTKIVLAPSLSSVLYIYYFPRILTHDTRKQKCTLSLWMDVCVWCVCMASSWHHMAFVWAFIRLLAIPFIFQRPTSKRLGGVTCCNGLWHGWTLMVRWFYNAHTHKPSWAVMAFKRYHVQLFSDNPNSNEILFVATTSRHCIRFIRLKGNTLTGIERVHHGCMCATLCLVVCVQRTKARRYVKGEKESERCGIGNRTSCQQQELRIWKRCSSERDGWREAGGMRCLWFFILDRLIKNQI